ncbi:unnamed protein product [Camellia sinensis]
MKKEMHGALEIEDIDGWPVVHKGRAFSALNGWLLEFFFFFWKT